MKPAAQKARCCRSAAANPEVTKGAAPPSAPGQLHDLVCGMVVDPVTAKNQTEHGGQIYYFCCGGCKAKFLADPTQYLNPKVKPTPSVPNAPSAQSVICTCPMHPQIRRARWLSDLRNGA